MKRNLILLILCSAFLVHAEAQEKYSVVLEQTRQLSPYEAIYQLMDYQQWQPEMPGVYFELGGLCYRLLPTRDPLHHYSELSQLLYRTKLFYGNCLHFAKDKKLPGWQYDAIANDRKKIEYSDLEGYIRPRLQEVKRQQIACDSIHNSFTRMTELYDRCRAQFTTFLTHYTREKTAHLRLQAGEWLMLYNLQRSADSMDLYIAQYQQALALQKIPGYQPVFRKEEILLYRLDGLTYTDFMQNDIAIWDYSGWVRSFLREQALYKTLYTDVARELIQLKNQVRQYQAGQAFSGQTDAALIGRCDRLELATSQVDSIRALQQTVRNAVAERMIAQSAAPTTIRELTPLLLIAAERRNAVPDSAITLLQQHLIQMAQPLRSQHQPTYTNPVSGDIIRYQPQPDQTVFCLLPDNTGYRCVLTQNNDIYVFRLERDLSSPKPLFLVPAEQPLVFTRIPGDLWVLITDKDVHFLP